VSALLFHCLRGSVLNFIFPIKQRERPVNNRLWFGCCRDEVQVEQGGNQLGPNDLQACLRQGEWNRALDILTQMVGEGRAAATAVSNDAHPLDITRAHPELVMLLRGQALFDLRGMGNANRAHAYYLNHICVIYPDGFSTGIEFVDKLLVEIHAMVHREALPRSVLKLITPL
jgi:hypothetical protein